MIIGACTLRLYLPEVHSLKEKRGLLRPLLTQLRRRFELAVAEIGNQDVWQSADVALVAVANDTSHIYAVLEQAVRWIEDEYRAVQLLDWQVELR